MKMKQKWLACLLVNFVFIRVAFAVDEELAGPGWIHTVPDTNAMQLDFSAPSDLNAYDSGATADASLPSAEGNFADEITPDIKSLAAGLFYNPTNIFAFVFNQIEYSHYFGSKKGATLTLQERSGNDFDQCALLAALLRESGFTCAYRFAVRLVPYESTNAVSMRTWLGIDANSSDIAGVSNQVSQIMTNAGWPLVVPQVVVSGSPPVTNVNFFFPRVTVVFTNNGIGYYLDPSLKAHIRSFATNWQNSIGLNRTNILAAAGGFGSGDAVYGIDAAALSNHLGGLTSDLLQFIRTQHPNSDPGALIDQRFILPWLVSPLSTNANAGIYTNSQFPGVLRFSEIPTNFMSSLQVRAGSNLDTNLFLPELKGARLALTFETNQQAKLSLDDVKRGEETIGPGTNTLAQVILTVRHPFGKWMYNSIAPQLSIVGPYRYGQSVTNNFRRTLPGQYGWEPRYAIIYSFDDPRETLRRREDKLDQYLRNNLSPSSHEVVLEGLNVMGLHWLWESYRSDQLASSLGKVVTFNRHQIGRMAQEEGFFVDVSMSSSFSWGSAAGANAAYPDVATTLDSALEHAIIGQLQGPTNNGVSTVRLIARANETNGYIFRASSTNWGTIRPWLVSGGYTSSQLTSFDQLVNTGAVLLVTSNATVPINHWLGTGYAFVKITGGDHVTGYLIDGGFFGGYNSWQSLLDYGPVVSSAVSLPTYFDLVPTFAPTLRAADPVNLADGSFNYDSQHLVVGQSEPRGFSFAPHYSSSRRDHRETKLGYGWTHNYDIRIVERPAIEAAMGLTTPEAMAAYVVAAKAALEVQNGASTAKEWLTTALIAKWAVDQLLTNGLAVIMGKDTIQFVRQPDGTFTPPAGCTMTLTLTNNALGNGVYELRQRHGNIFRFNTDKRLAHIEDLFGKKLTFSYQDGRLTTVADDYSRVLTITYNGTNYVSSVSENTGTNRSISFTYDNYDLTKITDEENKDWHFEYDGEHRMQTTRDPLNRIITTNIYDAFSRVIEQHSEGDANKTWRFYYAGILNTEQDPAGAFKGYFYDTRSRLVAMRDAIGNNSVWRYDGQDHIISSVSAQGETNTFQYDGNHNLLVTTDRLGLPITNTYDTLHRLIAVRDARGFKNTFGYNDQHQLLSATNPLGQHVDYTYVSSGGAVGQIQFSTDEAGKTTTLGYDSKGQLNSIAYPDSLGSESFQNSDRGDVEWHTDSNGNKTQFEYNKRRQLTRTYLTNYFDTSVVYDPSGNAATNTDPRGFSITNLYSATRKLLRAQLPAIPSVGAPVVTNTYDARDWHVAVTDPLQHTTRFIYASNQWLLATADPLNRTNRFGYDANGQRTNTTDALLFKSSSVYNARGETIVVTNANANKIGFLHDEGGNQTALTNRLTNTFRFAFDGRSRITNTVSPVGKSVTNRYEARGLLGTNNEPSGQTATFQYDARGRLKTLADPAGTITYDYDANGNVLTNSEGSLKLKFAYDALNRATNYVDAYNNQIQLRYDASGNLTNVIYPGNRTVTYTYDSHNRLTLIADWTNRQTSLSYDLAGQLRQILRFNGTQRVLDYDDAGQVTSVTEYGTNGTTKIFQSIFTNDLGGRITDEVRVPPPASFTAPTFTATFNADNEITQYASTTLTRDADGNLVDVPATNGWLTLKYDARNRVTNSVNGTQTVNYRYDPAGNRIGVAVNGQTNKWLIAPGGALMREKPDGSRTFYVYGAVLLYEVDEQEQTRVYHYDLRGSTVALTDGQGKFTDRFEYDPYGEVTYRAGKTDTPFQFHGVHGVQTDANGLVKMGMRYYSPRLCRFTTPDPAGFSGGLNVYAFAAGNPVSLIDPGGTGPQEIGASWLRGPSYSAEDFQHDAAIWSYQRVQAQLASAYAITGPGITAGQLASATLNLVPLVGGLKMFGETLAGQDAITGGRIADSYSHAAGAVLNLATATAGAGRAVGGGSRALSAGATSAPARSVPVQLEFDFVKDFTRPDVGQVSGLVIGRSPHLSAPGALGPGEYRLTWLGFLPEGQRATQAQIDAELLANKFKLQEVMRLNLPIRDATSILDTSGTFLQGERGFLRSSTWTYRSGYWMPPTK